MRAHTCVCVYVCVCMCVSERDKSQRRYVSCHCREASQFSLSRPLVRILRRVFFSKEGCCPLLCAHILLTHRVCGETIMAKLNECLVLGLCHQH